MTDKDSKRAFEVGQTEFSFNIEFEAPPRDIRRLLGGDPDTLTITDESGLFDGEYRRCAYCDDDSLIEVDYYETHLSEEHGLEP